MNKKYEPYPFKRILPGTSSSLKRRKLKLRLLKLKIHKPSLRNIKANGQKLLSLQMLFPMALAFVFARASILEELTPFIFAWLAALSYRRTGLALSIFFSGALGIFSKFSGEALAENLLALSVLTIVMLSFRCRPERLYFILPILAGCVVFVAKSLPAFFLGINYFQEMIIIFDAISTVLLTPVFLYCRKLLASRKAFSTWSYEDLASGLFLITISLLGLNDLKLGNLQISSLLCRYAILLAAFTRGSGGGTIMGVISGVIPSLSSSLFAPALGMYAISGLLAGLLRGIGRLGCILGFLLGVLALSFYFLPGELTLYNLLETLIAGVAFFLTAGFFPQTLPVNSKAEAPGSNLAYFEVKELTQNRIHHLSQVFAEIGASFAFNPSKKEAGSIAYINYLYDTLSQELCSNCIHHNSCWVKDSYHISQELLQLFTLAESNGHLSINDLPEYLRKKCIRKAELIHNVNHLYDTIRLHEYWNQKLGNSRELLAKQLTGISEMVKNLAYGIDFTQQIDYALKDELMQKAQQTGNKIKEIIPMINPSGQLQIQVVALACNQAGSCTGEWQYLLSEWLGYPMSIVSRSCQHHSRGTCSFTLQRSCPYRVESGSAQISKEEICGDSFHFAQLPNAKMVAVLSDGMGSGLPARQQSQTAIRLLDTMLAGGFDKEIALETINSVLLLRSKEDSFATMDLVVVDLFTAEADIIKTAAAPSFFKRSRHIEMVTSSSLPVGILPQIDIHHEKISLIPGDMVILVSDGVLETAIPTSGEEWMQKLLSQIDESDPQALADYILTQALACCKGKVQDDMTVLCLLISLP